jgi:hypothetical protein
MRQLALCLILLGCSAYAGDKKTTAGDVKKEASETLDATKRLANEKKEDFEARMKARLDELKTETGKLREKAKQGGETAKKEVGDKLEELEKKEKAADERLGELRKSTKDAWKSLKGGVESAVDDLERGLGMKKSP